MRQYTSFSSLDVYPIDEVEIVTGLVKNSSDRREVEKLCAQYQTEGKISEADSRYYIAQAHIYEAESSDDRDLKLRCYNHIAAIESSEHRLLFLKAEANQGLGKFDKAADNIKGAISSLMASIAPEEQSRDAFKPYIQRLYMECHYLHRLSGNIAAQREDLVDAMCFAVGDYVTKHLGAKLLETNPAATDLCDMMARASDHQPTKKFLEEAVRDRATSLGRGWLGEGR